MKTELERLDKDTVRVGDFVSWLRFPKLGKSFILCIYFVKEVDTESMGLLKLENWKPEISKIPFDSRAFRENFFKSTKEEACNLVKEIASRKALEIAELKRQAQEYQDQLDKYRDETRQILS
jgi:chaperonin cofactor prefoldin